MSARNNPARPERDRLAAALARHAPRGAVRVAEALAAVAINRRRRAEGLWNGAFADTPPAFDDLFPDLPERPIGERADAAWAAACRRIAARAIGGAMADPTAGAHRAAMADAAAPPQALILTARIGPYAFFRADAGGG